MNLKSYLRGLSPEDREAFALTCGTTLKYLKQVAYKGKKANAELTISIERESGGEVPVEEVRPDIDWSFRRARAASCPEAA